MSKRIAKVLISQFSIPNDGYVSWPQRLEYLLQHYPGNSIDYLVCGDTTRPLNSNTKRILCTEAGKVSNKLFKSQRFNSYKQALAGIVAKHEFVIACVVDSAKLKNVLYDFLVAARLERKVRIIYYQCGFSHYFSRDEHVKFAAGISELILLSTHSYHSEFARYPDMPYAVHVLHNPIDHTLFKPLPAVERKELRDSKKMDGDTNFIWVSHDKPVKGLQVILEAWKLFYKPGKKAVLHVIGVMRNEQIPGVIFHGKITNRELPGWYQSCDINIFSPMRNEGYGLALAEAISCGCMAIATYAGGAVDFFKEGEHGVAIREPNFLHVWAAAFDKAIGRLAGFREEHKEDYTKPPPFATYDEWCVKFIDIFDNIEGRLVS